MATFREDRNGEAEQRSLLRAEPGGAPQRRLRVSAGGAAGILAVTALVAVLGVPELFQSKSFGTESGSKELLVSKAIETPQLGGTLVPGPGCPVACGSFVQCATDRRSKNNLLPLTVDLELNKVVHQALADEGVRKAVKSAEAEGYSAASLKAEMDALGSAIGFGPHHRRVYGLVHSFLAERDVQKTLENWVAEAYSEQAEDDVRQLVLKKAMTPRPPMWGSPILLHPPVRPSAAGALPAWPRRLQPPSYFANFPFLPQSNGFRGRGSVPCPGSDCFISFLQLNDRICDCPGCTDEDAFECDSCVPKVPFGPTVAATQSNLGVAVGVSLGVAVGVGLGVGLGVSAALGGVFSAVGVVQFTVANAQDFINNPQVQQGLKKAFLRLAGLAIAESAVTLNWACAGDALAQINSKLRRLAEAVRLCFEIEIEGEEKSLDACEDLASTSSGTAGRVINEELQNAAAASGSVQVVQWSANPNPLSKDPTRVAPSKTFAAPKAVAFDPGNLPPGLSTGPAAPAEPPPVKR